MDAFGYGVEVVGVCGVDQRQHTVAGKTVGDYGKGGPYGKKSKRRIIPMTERVRRLVEYHFAETDTVSMSGRTVDRVIKKVANCAGIGKPVSAHVLRHTFSVNCIKRGISTRVLQSLLGHDRLGTTEIYLNPLTRGCN